MLMDKNQINFLIVEAGKNYKTSLVYTFISVITVLYTVYSYSVGSLYNKNDSTIMYIYLAVTVLSIISSLIFSKKIKPFQDDIKKIIMSNKALYILHNKTKGREGLCFLVLIVVLVISFFVKGTALWFLDDIGFLIIIFSYWFTSKSHVMILEGCKNIIK